MPATQDLMPELSSLLDRFEMRLMAGLDQWASRKGFSLHESEGRHSGVSHLGDTVDSGQSLQGHDCWSSEDEWRGPVTQSCTATVGGGLMLCPTHRPQPVDTQFERAPVGVGTGPDAELRPLSPTLRAHTTVGQASKSTAGKRKTFATRLSYSADDLRKKEAAQRKAIEDTQSVRPVGRKQFRTKLIRLLSSPHCETLIAISIMVSSLFVGFETDMEARRLHEGEPWPDVFFACSCIFTAIFTVELVIRLLAFRWGFFGRDKLWWSCVDSVLVVSALLETGIQILVRLDSYPGIGHVGDASALRLLRILRITRILRTLRMTRLVRFIASLRTLVASIWATLQSLMWALLLLVIIIYTVAIVLTQVTTEHLSEVESDDVLNNFWGNLPLAMLTLFKSIAGGVSWHDVVEPLSFSPWLVGIFTMYIFFTYFAVLNVITGVFCQSAIETVAQDPDLGAQAVLNKRKSYTEKLQGLFGSVDRDGSGQITISELETLLSDEHMQAYLAAMGVEVDDAWSMFKLIDADESGSIDVDEFVNGVIRLQGNAKSVDMQTMLDSQRWMARRLANFMGEMEAQLVQRFSRTLSRIEDDITSSSRDRRESLGLACSYENSLR